jgi:F0F1-type ATP synthase assembly protein I
MPKPPGKDSDPGFRTAGLLLTIPTLLVVSPLVGFFLGRLVERWLPIAPWGTFVGLILGFVAAGRETYRILRRVQADQEEEDRRR